MSYRDNPGLYRSRIRQVLIYRIASNTLLGPNLSEFSSKNPGNIIWVRFSGFQRQYTNRSSRINVVTSSYQLCVNFVTDKHNVSICSGK